MSHPEYRQWVERQRRQRRQLRMLRDAQRAGWVVALFCAGTGIGAAVTALARWLS